MKKNFLLLLLLTLLPLAGWAQTAVWSGGTPDIKYGDALTGLGAQVTVVSANGNQECINMGEGTSTPTGDVNQFHWKIYKGTEAQNASSTLDVGNYTLQLYIRHQTGTVGFYPVYGDGSATLNFTIKKGEVTVTGYDITKVWDNGVTDPTIADFGANASWRSVSGINGTDDEKWDLVKGYLAFQRVDNGTDVATYKYTFTATGAPTNFDLKFVGGNLNVTQATNVVVDPLKVTIADWTYGETASNPANDNAFKYGNDQVVYTYSVKGAGNFTDQVPTEAGEYTLKATVPEHLNYAPEVSVEVDFKIKKATTPLPVITAVGGPFTYLATIDESAFTVTKTSDGALSYTYQFKAPGASTFAPATGFDGSAGTWKVFAHQAEGTNWKALDDVTGFEFTVAPKELVKSMLTKFNTPQTYNGTQILTGYEIKDGATKLVNLTDFEYTIEDEDGNTVTSAKNAGTYTYTFTGKGNYTSSFTKELVVEKANWPAANIVDPTLAATWTYDGTEHALITTPAAATGLIAADVADPTDFVYYLNDAATAIADIKATNANEDPGYKVSYSIKETANYNAVAKKDLAPVKVEKKKLTITGATLNGTYTVPEIQYSKEQLFVCDDDDFAPVDKTNGQTIAAGLINIALVEGSNTISVPEEPAKVSLGAGNYTIKLTENTGATVKNYKIKQLTDGVLAIAQAENEITALTIADWTYGDAANDPVIAAKFGASTVTYEYFKGTESLGATAPTAAGENYSVKATIAETKNYKKAEKTATFKINKKDLAITLVNKTKVYSGDPATDPELTATSVGLVNPETLEALGLVITRAAGEDVGTYAITGTVDAEKAANYAVSFTPGVFTITQATNAITNLAIAGWEYGSYNATTNAPTYTAKFKAANEPKFTYAVKGSTEFSDKVPVNAGDYTVKATIAATANWAAAEATKDFTITKAPLTLTADNATKVYEEEDPIFKLANEPAYKNGDNAEKIGLSFTREKAGTPEGENVGEYKIIPAATSTNYIYTINNGTLKITKQAVTPTAPSANVLTYNGQNQALVKAGSAKGSTIQYALGDGAFGDAISEAKDAGTYTVKYKFTPGDNFSIDPALATGTVEVKILQAKLRFRMGKQEETYTGEAFEPKAGEAYTLAEGGFFTGDEDVLTFAFEEGFDATTACEEGRAFDRLVYTFKDGIANYTVGFENDGLLIIKKAAPAELVETPVAENRTYNGLAQTLVTAGKVKVVDEKPLGTIMFNVSKDGKGEYTTAVPQATDALKYDAQENRPAVWFKVVGDANHKDTDPKQITGVEIKPYELTADMIKGDDEKPLPTPYQKPYKAEVQSFPMKLMVKLAADKNPRTLKIDENYTVLINDKAPKDVTIKNAGDYVYKFTGKGNYKGTISTTATITKGELIATAPNAVKTYDGTAVIEPEEFECTATQLKLYGGLEISGLLADDKIDLGGKTIADIIVPEGSAINVGTYNLKVNLAAIPVQANYTFNAQTFNGKLTINKAEAVKIGFTKQVTTVDPFWPTVDVDYKPYHKTYGTADPAFITEKGTNDVTSISGDLEALEGELFEDNAVVATLLGATRTAGEVYTKDGYTVKLGWKNTSNTAELAKIATFKNNYKNVTFGTTKLFIDPFAGTIKVSIKSDAVVFDGKEHADAIAWAEDLSNMVVVGLPAGKDKKEIFTELPKITVTPKDGKVRNAGDYNITFEGGKSENYDMKKVQFVLGSYLTIEPFEITPDMVKIADQQAKIGDKAKDAINHTAFEFKKHLDVEADENLFQVVATPDFVNNGLITVKENAKPAEGLTLALKDKLTAEEEAEAKNYIGYDEVFGYLAVIGTPNLLVLDDKKDIETYDRENTDVTFTSRTISQDNWNVFCLPFDATIKEISDAFGYAAVDLLKKESVDGSMHFVVTTSGTVPAGEPFIIKPTSDPELNAVDNFDQVRFSGVTVKAFSDNPEPVKDSAGNKFCGTFKAHTYFFGEKFWYMSKSEWKQASNFTEAKPVDLGAYRAYIETATAGARIFIEEPDGTITAINAIDLNNNTMDEGWYTVNGMKLNAAPTQKGTYIKDGKKVFVK